jgi:hypothetical protein
MSDMPMVVVPLSLSAIEIAFGMLFLGFFYNEVRYLPPTIHGSMLNC